MALTPGGTPFVEASDLVADYPATSLALAEHIDDLPSAILQVVRATDTTNRTTTSTSFVDVTGMSVTITPQKSDSAVLLIAVGTIGLSYTSGNNNTGRLRITDSSNNPISGANQTLFGTQNFTYSGAALWVTSFNLVGHATPATTSAVTFKLQFMVDNALTTNTVRNNNDSTGQLYAIEVSA